MDKTMKKVVVGLYAEILSLTESKEERIKKLEEFDEVFGVEIRGWEEMMKKKISESEGKHISEAIQSVDDYYAKNHVYDESGNLLYEQIRVGNSLHQIIITYDANAPEGMRISLQEVPEIEAMSHNELQNYYEELQSRQEELTDEEPDDEESEDHKEWEDNCDQLEGLIDEVEERLEKMESE